MITTVYLPDGTVLSSGTPGEAAICSFSHTETVCSGRELSPGGCCAAMVQLELFGTVALTEGAEVEIHRGGLPLGKFIVTELRTADSKTAITAYDRIILLDREVKVSGGTLLEIAADVCSQCGLTLKNETLPCGDYPVSSLSGTATGRQILQWVGEATGCFCVADPEGLAELRWFTPKEVNVQWYYRSSFEGYEVAPVEKVQIADSTTDQGVVWPNLTEQVNTFVLRGNPLLSTTVTKQTEPLAQHL